MRTFPHETTGRNKIEDKMIKIRMKTQKTAKRKETKTRNIAYHTIKERENEQADV